MREIEIQATISRSLYREMVYFQMFRRKRTTLPFGIVAYLLAAGTVIAKLTGYYTVDSYAFGMFTFYACDDLSVLPAGPDRTAGISDPPDVHRQQDSGRPVPPHRIQ